MTLKATFSRALLAVTLGAAPIAVRTAEAAPDPLAPSQPASATHFSADTKTARLIDLDAVQASGGNAFESNLKAVTAQAGDDQARKTLITSGLLGNTLAEAAQESPQKPIIAFSKQQNLAIFMNPAKGVIATVPLNNDPGNSLFWAMDKTLAHAHFFTNQAGKLTELKQGRSDILLDMMKTMEHTDRDLHNGVPPPKPPQNGPVLGGN